MNKIDTLCDWINASDNIVFFGGAGVSTESGIPDFRSTDGLYNQKYKIPPEEVISHSFFMAHPDEFYRFYKDRMLSPDAKPNITHKTLARLEQMGKLKLIITQNIDGLHQKAGSRKVDELHGSVLRNHCMECGTMYTLEDILKDQELVPHCPKCGGLIKPDVVLYEESLKEKDIADAVHAIEKADVLIVAGTSLVVYPAAGLINYYNGHKLVLINCDPTAKDNMADLVIHDSLGNVFNQVADHCLPQ